MNRVVALALRQKLLVLALLATMLVAGGIAFARLNIEAYPDPVPPLVEIITQSSGLSAEEIERNITIPIEVQMAGIPHITAIRAISLFGLSDIKVQFTYDFAFNEAEQRVINRLSQLPPLIGGAQPTISPDSPTGEIFRFRVTGPPGYSVMDLKTVEDWIVQRRLKAVPGVIDVSAYGGKTRTYEAVVDQNRLIGHGVTVAQVIAALGKSNANVGGQTVDFGAQAAIVRGIGLIQSVADIQNVLVATVGGQPVLLGDIATVKVGNLPRQGIMGQDGDDDIVEGVVLMQRGAQSTPTIDAVKAKIAEINASNVLPPGVRLTRIYDRSDLIGITTDTVIHNMVEGMVLIFILQWLFLGNLRSALIVATTIPFALCFAVLILTAQGESANLLSVGALDFGLIVDATVIMVENIYRHLAERSARASADEAPLTRANRRSAVLGASVEVSRGIFFAAAIIIASFIPLFTLTGIEGHIFGPMAKTYAYAIAGGLIATFTVAPVLSALLLPDKLAEVETWLLRHLRRGYDPAIRFALANRILVVGGASLLIAVAGLTVGALGVEFLPHLEEGNMWIRATLPASISLADGNVAVNGIRRIIASYPEVETVVSHQGRPDDGTDASSIANSEYFVPLKPFDTWPGHITKEQLTEDMSKRLAARYPGVEFNFSQYIEDNVEEATSGVKGENSVKLFGPDLATLERVAGQIKDAMAKVHGIADLGVFASLGQPTVKVEIDRAKAARYGLTPDDINSTVQAAIGGQATTDLYETRTDRHFPIVVRLRPEQRGSLEAIRAITVGATGDSGATVPVPLSEVADVHLTSGASFIYREHQERYVPIKFSVRDRDLGSAVAEAKANVAREVKLPAGYTLEWAGELDNLQNAVARLEIVVPISLGLILVLLYANFGSIRDTLLAASVMPMALVGGVLALVLTGTAFSISAAIGFVALLGIATMDGIIVLSAFNNAIDEGLERGQALALTCTNALRPVVMTCLAACIGLLPAAVSHGIGSQVQRPLALVVVGGTLLAPVLILLVLPVLIDMISTRMSGNRHAPGRGAPVRGAA